MHMKTLNVELIKQLKIRVLLVVIFLISTIFILTFHLSAQEKEKERGYKGPISLDRMRSIFSKGENVEGYVIKGDDIIDIIEKTDFEIDIDNSIIEGGLDFRKLAVPLEKKNLPEYWNEKEKESFIETKSYHSENIPVVKNEISINNSEIRKKKGLLNSIYAYNTLFHETIYFMKNTFCGDASFTNATFSKNATFLDATFSGEANFSFATFSDEASFYQATFSGDAYFSLATFSDVLGDNADFRFATFSDKAEFYYSTFNGDADFSSATFSGDAYFSRSTFGGDAYFLDSIFSREANFIQTNFIKVAYFRRASFFRRLYAIHAVFKEYADFRESKIRRLNFKSILSPTIVEGRIDFRNVIISGAHFQDIIFEKDIDFSDAKFGIPLNIVRLDELSHSIEIPDSLDELLQSLEFPDSLDELLQSLEFPDSLRDKIHYKTKEKLLIFTGYMTKSEKEELARLSEDSQYRKAVEQLFRESTLGPFAVVFRFATFESDAYFLRAKFFGDTALERVTFKKEANFTDADFKGKKENDKQKFSLSYFNFNNLLIKWGQLPNPKSWVSETRIKSFNDIEGEEEVERGERLEPLSQVLKGLEANFRNQKQLSDANKAYYFRKKAEFKEERKKNSKAYWKWFPKQALWSLWWISCGYGTKILWILGWIIFFDLLFAMLYSIRDNLHKKSHPETKGEFTFKQRLFDFPRLYLREAKPLDMIKSKLTIKFINALRFSSVILLKIGYRDTKISGKILGIDCKYFVWFEWLLGFYLLACLTVTMSNTVPIINRLISGMF